MGSQAKYHPFEDVEPGAFWRDSSLPLENYLWALIRIDGIDAYQWVECSLRIHAVGQPKWAEDVRFFTSVLSWAAYEDDVDSAQWPWPKPNAFDERWPLRFAAAARERGHSIDADDMQKLKGDLTALIVDYRPDFRRMDGANFGKFWLVASASILLAELQPRESVRRIFPLGTGQDVDLAKAPREWAVRQGVQDFAHERTLD